MYSFLALKVVVSHSRGTGLGADRLSETDRLTTIKTTISLANQTQLILKTSVWRQGWTGLAL